MKKLTLLGLIVLSICAVGHAATITVTTSASTGAGSLYDAISALNDGDTIAFNIPGAGPHYIQTPTNGYPIIAKHRITIDGYTQPGSSPNSNPILASNNAQIKIVLSSTNSIGDEEYTDMNYNSSTNRFVGFTPTEEFVVLGIFGVTNVTIKGLSIIGTPGTSGAHYGIGLAQDTTHPCTGAHIAGCWIGVEPSGVPTRVRITHPDPNDPDFTVIVTNLWDFQDCVAAFSHRYEFSYTVRGTNSGCTFTNTILTRPGRESDWPLLTEFLTTNTCAATSITTNNSSIRYVHTNHTIGVAVGSANARAEFNVLVGGIIPIAAEGQMWRISGNFIGVLPDGMHDYIVPFAESGRFMEGTIEIGRGASDCVIGTDGDGVNDADERNVFGGVPTNGDAGSKDLGGYTHVIELYSASGSPGPDRQRNRIAGNYVGVAIDGITRFTNGVPFFNGSTTGNNQYWIGSDFDGVSDDIEANVIFNNYPPGLFYNTAYTNSPQGGGGSQGFFDQLGNSALVSMRGNIVVNNYPFPVNPGQGTATDHNAVNYGSFVTNYMNKAVVSPFTNLFFPILSSNSTTARIKGTVPIGKLPYAYTILDFYTPDPEGLTNGLVVPEVLLPNGWVHGRKYLGSYTIANTNLNTGSNLSPTAGTFEINTCGLGLTNGSQITVSANYSQDPPGTHNARVLTSLFSAPLTVGAGIVITSITRDAATGVTTINWCGGVPPYKLQRKAALGDAFVDIQTGLTGTSTTDSTSGNATAFYQIIGQSN